MKIEKQKQKSKFAQIFSGDFLFHPKLVKWYPYILLLFALAMISVVNEKIIQHKNRTILRKQYEYKLALTELKENNLYLPYNQKKIIRDRATLRGFIESHKTIFKITVKN